MQVTATKLGRLRFKPTALGWVFLIMTLMGWVMSVNYNNNLLYMVVFVLLSLMLVSLILGWLNLHRIRLVGAKTKAAFAGEKLHTQLNVANDNFTVAEGVFASLSAKGGEVDGDRVSIDSDSVQLLTIDPNTFQRGLFQVSPLSIASVYPIGLFVFYRPVLANLKEWVYPQSAGDYQLEDYLNQHSNQSGIEADEMQTLRTYQPSDSPSHINWKVYARSEELMTSDYDGGVSTPSVILDEEVIKELPLESRLSQLSKWIVEAEHLGGEYGLKLGKKVIAADKGSEHQTECLVALAEYQSSQNPEPKSSRKVTDVFKAMSLKIKKEEQL